MQIVNQGRVDVEYIINKRLPIVRDTKFSNRVVTYILEGRLFIKKEASKEIAGVLEIYKYKIHIMNISMLPVNCIKLIDDVSANLHMISNSIIINGKKTRRKWVKCGICIGTLNPQECCEIEFSVYGLLTPSEYYICNCAKVQYDYLYQIDKKPLKFLQSSNKVITKIENKLLKSMSTQFTLCIPGIGRRGVNIEPSDMNIEVINTKAIHTAHGSFVLVIGVISYNIDICYHGAIKVPVSYVEGFSTIIKVPDAIFCIPSISCDVDIKASSINKLDCNRVSISTALVLSVKRP